jgi:hypothetical protein
METNNISNIQYPPTIAKRSAWISAELIDFSCRKIAAEKIERVVQEFHGEVVGRSCFLETLSVKATFSHRRYKALNRAISVALVGLPVGEITVGPHDPVAMRFKRNPAAWSGC